MLNAYSRSFKIWITIAALLSGLLVPLYLWWFQPPFTLLMGYLGLSVLSLLSVALTYRLFGYFKADEMALIEAREQSEYDALQRRLKEVREALDEIGLDEGVHQCDTLMGIIDDYHNVIETRFFGKTFSPLTYLSAARRVQQHALQNLVDLVAVGHSMSTIRHSQRKEEKPLNPKQHHRKEKQSALMQTQEARIKQLLEENNTLYNALMETAVEVANIRSINTFERTDTLARLVTLANVARNS